MYNNTTQRISHTLLWTMSQGIYVIAFMTEKWPTVAVIAEVKWQSVDGKKSLSDSSLIALTALLCLSHWPSPVRLFSVISLVRGQTTNLDLVWPGSGTNTIHVILKTFYYLIITLLSISILCWSHVCVYWNMFLVTIMFIELFAANFTSISWRSGSRGAVLSVML